MAAQIDRPSKASIPVEEFEARLRSAGLTKLRFSELTGMRRSNVIRWNKNGAPAWAVSWLMMYRRASKAVRTTVENWADFRPQ